MILLIGSEGSMGKRYQAIFNHLGLEYHKCDLKNNPIFNISLYDKIVLATPTDSHYDLLKQIIGHGRDILCEKPISKSVNEVIEILNLVKTKENCKFNMVFQYGELAPSNNNPHQFTSYDYFRTGNDGLKWDCLQIIALASGPIKIQNKSPYWKCMINDSELDLSTMDHAYVKFIKKWSLGHLKQNHEWLIDIHKKVENYVNE